MYVLDYNHPQHKYTTYCSISDFENQVWHVYSLVPRLPPVRAVKKITEGESLVRFRT